MVRFRSEGEGGLEPGPNKGSPRFHGVGLSCGRLNQHQKRTLGYFPRHHPRSDDDNPSTWETPSTVCCTNGTLRTMHASHSRTTATGHYSRRRVVKEGREAVEADSEATELEVVVGCRSEER